MGGKYKVIIVWAPERRCMQQQATITPSNAGGKKKKSSQGDVIDDTKGARLEYSFIHRLSRLRSHLQVYGAAFSVSGNSRSTHGCAGWDEGAWVLPIRMDPRLLHVKGNCQASNSAVLQPHRSLAAGVPSVAMSHIAGALGRRRVEARVMYHPKCHRWVRLRSRCSKSLLNLISPVCTFLDVAGA